MSSQRQTIGILACIQIISWGSIHYAFGIVAPIIHEDLRWPSSLVFGDIEAGFQVTLANHAGALDPHDPAFLANLDSAKQFGESLAGKVNDASGYLSPF